MSDSEPETKPCPCGTITNNLTIECTECEAEWHLKCCGLDGLTKQPIKKLEEKGWKCPSCFEPAIHIKTAKKTTAALTQDTVDNIVTIVNSTIEANLKQLLAPENLTEDQTEFTENFTLVQNKRREKTIQKVLVEQKEEEILIKKKEDNLIIYGMPECTTEDKKEEMLEDFRRIKKVYSEKLEIEQNDLKHITRLGIKETDKVRPIQITLSSQAKRKEMLINNMNLKLLENEISTNIYVSTDRTKKQRDADKELRAELKRRKQLGENLVIRNNKIVPFRERAQITTWASLFD